MASLPALHECDVLVVGGGPAGVAAATELSARGLSVQLVEQGARLGGAIHRQPATPGTAPARLAVQPQWARLSRAVAVAKLSAHTGCVFLGVDSDGLSLVEDRRSGLVSAVRVSAVVVAVGAVERIRPRPGTELPGVTTAGGIQVMLKETGRAPQGRILVAGNGPLTIALAAQLARCGNPPLAVLEAGDPLRHLAAVLALMRHPRLVREALGYLRAMRASGTSWQRGTVLSAIARHGSDLVATTIDRAGGKKSLIVDRIALHDGIRPNSFGLPKAAGEIKGTPFVIHAGDCREALGAVSAEADGRRAARIVVARLRGNAGDVLRLEATIARERSAQHVLARLFAPRNTANDPGDWHDDALLCQCERKSVADLRALLGGGDQLSPREIKLNGRFCMGACQGRFCADAVAELIATERPGTPRPGIPDLTGQRWPLRPVSIASIIGDRLASTAQEEK